MKNGIRRRRVEGVSKLREYGQGRENLMLRKAVNIWTIEIVITLDNKVREVAKLEKTLC